LGHSTGTWFPQLVTSMSSPQNFTFNRYTLTLDRPGIELPAELIV
jgi:hypothetical protein